MRKDLLWGHEVKMGVRRTCWRQMYGQSWQLPRCVPPTSVLSAPSWCPPRSSPTGAHTLRLRQRRMSPLQHPSLLKCPRSLLLHTAYFPSPPSQFPIHHMCAHAHTHEHTCTHMSIHMHIHERTWVCTHMHIYTAHSVHAHSHMHKHTHEHASAHLHVPTQTYTNVYTHTCTHTQACAQFQTQGV